MKKILLGTVGALLIFSATAMARNAMDFYNLGKDSSMTYRKIHYFTKALELNPGLSDAYEQRGMLYYFLEKYSKMIHDFTKFTELKPLDSKGYIMLGYAYMKKEDYNRAVDNLTRAIALKPQSAEAYGYRAEAYRLNKMLKEAIHDATRVIEIGAKKSIMGMAYSTRAKAYRDLGNNLASEADFKKAVNLDPAYDIYKYFTVTEYLADSAGNSGSLKDVSRMGSILIITIAFIFIFKLALSPPRKDEDKD